jgi:hypothetical protein
MWQFDRDRIFHDGNRANRTVHNEVAASGEARLPTYEQIMLLSSRPHFGP